MCQPPRNGTPPRPFVGRRSVVGERAVPARTSTRIGGGGGPNLKFLRWSGVVGGISISSSGRPVQRPPSPASPSAAGILVFGRSMAGHVAHPAPEPSYPHRTCSQSWTAAAPSHSQPKDPWRKRTTMSSPLLSAFSLRRPGRSLNPHGHVITTTGPGAA
ncbi:hypothetical protein MIND_00929600 [Mycena indigotica]|uniref:Uncharacterized protein n=1 Tax=Mycena indigotica TaxID=2126181 RepID=A0A8H6SCF0_9AGAR|nr:uncharacterized protein MIND_00929600 [Mycena indigotica]KAF7296975.1 hypothetical protein MIND_00929600 [Mycena indigotica]